MISSHFLNGFIKQAKLYSNMASAALKSIKKNTSLPTLQSNLSKAKKSIPKDRTDVLDYSKLRAEMSRKNIASRDTVKRRLSNISNRPVLTSKSSRFSY